MGIFFLLRENVRNGGGSPRSYTCLSPITSPELLLVWLHLHQERKKKVKQIGCCAFNVTDKMHLQPNLFFGASLHFPNMLLPKNQMRSNQVNPTDVGNLPLAPNVGCPPPPPTCNPSHRALASPPSPPLNERPGHTQPRLLAFNLFTGSLRLSHVIDHGNGGGGGGDGGGCRPGNVSLGGAAVEIKHFNYSRLVGGASHRKRPCDKDRWKKKGACVSTCRAGGEDHKRGLIHPADMNGALRARGEKGSEKYETSAAGVYGGGNRSPPRAAAAAISIP